MSDCGKAEQDDKKLSIDTSSFEFIEGRLSNSRGIAAWSSTPPPPATKEEKQKHNEEIVMESAGSWEKIEISDLQKDEIESCREFLVNEKSFNDEDESSRPNIPSKPCFIDASSLLDDDYMPISFAAARRDDPKGYLSTAGYSGPSSFSQPVEEVRKISYDIKDQFSAIPSQFNIPKSFQFQQQQHSSLHDVTSNTTTTADPNLHDRSQWQYHHHHPLNNDYASDVSSNYLPSEYSSESCGASGNFNNHTANSSSGSNTNNNNINTSGYSTNHSRYDSLAPETPYNSIVQLSKKLEICEIDGIDDDDDKKEYHARITSSPIPIKRISKCDESAPILSGGASIIDFTPQVKCDSPSVRRKTDSCPIVSGGSFDLIDEPSPVPKAVKSLSERERNSFSWIVDLKEDLKIVEEINEVREEQKTATPKNSLGFYVDFGSLESKPEKKLISKLARSEEGSAKKGTGFYVDFSDSSCPNTPKQTTRNPSTSSVAVEPKKIEAAAESGRDKKNFFNMYIDLSDSKDNDSSLEIEEQIREEKKEEEAVMSSSSSSKKGCFMFIESDASPLIVRHRANIASREPVKRHSWNVNQTPEYEAEMKASSGRKYQRSTSVNIPDKDLHEKSSIINVPSKTSSLSIGSSLSPHEDFSCSKSLSSRSNLSISTSNTSIDQSETKVQERAAVRRRRREAKINETYDKSSQGSVTDEIFTNQESPSSSTDTDDVTFQNQLEDDVTPCMIQSKEATLIEDLKNKMDTIVERSEHSSPFKKAIVAVEPIVESTNSQQSLPCHTMESLQQLIEKQKQILENTDSTSTSFVKLSDLDKPAPAPPANVTSNNRKDYPFMTNSAGFRVSLLENQNNHKGHQNMSRSTGNNFVNLASSVENSKSLSRLFPHLSKAFSSSVPSNVGFNNTDQNSLYEYVEFVSSDFSCTSSINSSRSGMDSADESSISCRQPRRLGSDLLKMFLQEIGTDIVIDVNGRQIKAHKVILRSRCQYFAATLAGKITEANGNVICLPGYSYAVVHFALCHVYSGAAHVPPGLDLMELASLSDLLGLEGLKEVTGYALKTNYCHNFHKPCSGCIDGVLQVVPVCLFHGFDELYRKCLKWICKHFSKVWSSKPFAVTPHDIQLRCSQQISAHLTSENVLDWMLDCENVLQTLDNCRWDTTDVQNAVNVLLDSVREYIMDHFASLIASDSFLSLGHDRKEVILKLEHSILKAAAKLSPEQACKSYPRAVRLNTLLNAKLIKFPSPLSNESFKPFERIQLRDEDSGVDWNDEFIKLVSAMLCAVEQSLIRQCNKAIKCTAWQRMDVDLRSKIQKIACVTENDESMRRTLRSSVTSIGSNSVRSTSASSTTSRANDLRQVKLVIQAHSQKFKTDNQTITVLTNKSTNQQQQQHPRTKQPAPLRDYKAGQQKIIIQPKLSDQFKPTIQKQWNVNDARGDPKKFSAIKSRYMEPRKTRLDSSDLPQIKAASGKNRMSSSENSTRDTSPAFVKKKMDLKKSSNLSLDSLQSPAKQRLSITRKDDESKTSSESLIRRNNFQNNKLKINTQTSTNINVQKSFLSPKSREILAKRSQPQQQQVARKLSTNSNSSVTTKSNKSSTSPRMIPINKSQSTSVVPSATKKVFSTTLHLRKGSRLPEPITERKNELNKLQRSATTKIYPSKETKIPMHQQKVPIKYEKELKVRKKSPKINVLVEDVIKDLDDEVFESKMARSNTFSKEQSDNPIELLKTMN